MNRTLTVAAGGMATQQLVLDNIAANLANVDVTGFRAVRSDFSSLITAEGRALAPQPSATQRLFTQGRLDFTNNPNDLAIEGDGLFAVRTATGKRAFTRAGNFSPNARGVLCLPNGAQLEGVRFPQATASWRVDGNGEVFAAVAGRRGEHFAGRISLISFTDPGSLRLDADGLFYQTEKSGRPTPDTKSNPAAHIKQRYLERANISVVGAMMAILAAQRAYEANAKAVQAADEMLRLANNLERG